MEARAAPLLTGPRLIRKSLCSLRDIPVSFTAIAELLQITVADLFQTGLVGIIFNLENSRLTNSDHDPNEGHDYQWEF